MFALTEKIVHGSLKLPQWFAKVIGLLEMCIELHLLPQS